MKILKIGLVILTLLVIGIVTSAIFMLNIKGPSIAMVYPNGPAAITGFQGGDQIISVDGQRVKTSQDFVTVINKNAGKNIEIVFYRGLTKTKLNIIPPLETLSRGGRLGIAVTDESLYASIINMFNKVKN